MKIIANNKNLIPAYETAGAGAFDMKCNITKEVTILPGQCIKVPSGLFMEIPEGHVGEISERSSSFLRGLLIRGKIDSDYRGEVFLLVRNVSNVKLIVEPFQRIAQMQITPSKRETFELSVELSDTIRGVGGFGHTGK